MRGEGHWIRITIIWLIASVIVEFLILKAPIPFPTMSEQAEGITQTGYMLFLVGAPIFVFVWVMLLYSVIAFRRTGPTEPPPVPRPDSNAILLLWAAISFTIVIFLAGWGTFTLHEITEPNGPHQLNIQVIGQQWFWSYRYPSYGGMETKALYIPTNTPIKLNITSLDVVHSMWIYPLDVKEDAVPGVATTAYVDVHPHSPTFSAHINNICNELCGLYHGYMHGAVFVVSKSKFTAWAKAKEAKEKSSGFLKNLPPYSLIYYPTANSFTPPPPQDQSP